MKYIIITPAHNEEKYIIHTLESVVNQTLKPNYWLIVNDGSTDKTKSIVTKYEKQYSWIKLVNKESNDNRSCGAKIVEAFYYGYNMIKSYEFDFIVKLDADLTLPPDYFEKITNTFLFNKNIGICGGYCVNIINEKIIKEKSPKYHVRGALKSIRKECWQDIGGFKNVLGWDGLDEMTAMYKGWEIKTIESAVIHHRPTAKAYNKFDLSIKHGIANYQNGGNVFLALIRTFVRLFKKPFLIEGIGFFIGYSKAYIRKYHRNVDKDLAVFINKFHTKRIFNTIKKT